MDKYTYTVSVWADTKDQADTVINERVSPDEDYGFDYVIAVQER